LPARTEEGKVLTLVREHGEDVLPLLRVGAEHVLVVEHDVLERGLERLVVRAPEREPENSQRWRPFSSLTHVPG